MGPDLDKGRLESAMEASGNKEAADVVKEPERKHMKCVNNYEDNMFQIEPLDEQDGGAERCDVEVDILGKANSVDNVLAEVDNHETTESSSSFDDTVHGVDNGTSLSDAEVESGLLGDASSPFPFDGSSEILGSRRKKLTSHWRAFIRPLVWRCKWVELQIKKFQSQAKKYDRELEEYNHKKQLETENCTLEGFGAKSLPSSGQSWKNEIMRRKKRKRVEDITDIGAYMLQHNLFSYYENKRSGSDAALMDNNLGNQVVNAEKTSNGNNEGGANDELLLREFGDGDNPLEQVLWKIGIVQLQVSKMKTRLQKVMTENAENLSFAEKLSLPESSNALNSSDQNPVSPQQNGDRVMPVGSYIANQLVPEHTMVDMVLPESAASSHGEVSRVPGIIESTNQNKPEVGGASRNVVDGILIYNRRPKEGRKNLKAINIQATKKSQAPKEEQPKKVVTPAAKKLKASKEEEEGGSVSPGHDPEPDPPEGQPAPKIRSIAKLTANKNKRTRGRRKAGSSKWVRRS